MYFTAKLHSKTTFKVWYSSHSLLLRTYSGTYAMYRTVLCGTSNPHTGNGCLLFCRHSRAGGGGWGQILYIHSGGLHLKKRSQLPSVQKNCNMAKKGGETLYLHPGDCEKVLTRRAVSNYSMKTNNIWYKNKAFWYWRVEEAFLLCMEWS